MTRNSRFAFAVRLESTFLAGLKAWLLAGGALACLCAGQASAAEHKRPSPRPSPQAQDDGLGARDVYMEADALSDDRAKKVVVADGHVEVRYQGRTLRAEHVDYDTVTGVVRARGQVTILNADGTSEFGDTMILDDQFRTGVALGFAARLQDNVTIVAGASVRRTDQIQELRSGTYTPCAICKADGVTPKRPTWAIRASRIVQDREHQVIYYRNAIILVKGVPVFYFPVLWHPDPSVPRQSGFLTPKILYSKRLGFSYQQPYLFAISPSTSLVVDPQFDTRVNPLLNVQYTEKFYSGTLDVRAGYTHEQIFDTNAKYGSDTNRSYILAHGRFNFDQFWDWGFGAERVTDPTLFRRYDVISVFNNRGIYPTDTDRLISQLFSTREDGQSYVSIAALSFQSIRQNGVTTLDSTGKPILENGKPTTRATFETTQGFPVVAPLVDARWDPTFDLLGGRLRAEASAVLLNRSDPVYSAYDPLGVVSSGPQYLSTTLASVVPHGGAALSYTDSRQASGNVEWRRNFTLIGGVRLETYAQARADVFSVGDAHEATTGPTGVTMQAAAGSTTRGLGTLGTTLSWPLIRQVGNSSLILEPIVQLAVSPRQGLNLNIPNEDSVAFEFDETNLFSYNRLPGVDLYEGGFRANVGGRANLVWDGGHTATLTVGRVFRDAPDPIFTLQTGLQGTSSDYVVAGTVSPINGLQLFSRSRLDTSSFHVHREEFGADFSAAWFRGGVRYDYNENALFVNGNGIVQIGKTEDANANFEAFPLKNWGASVNFTRDLQQKINPIEQFGLIYRDDCIRVDVIYTHDETYAAAIGASNSITVRLTLATFGDTSQIGRRHNDSR